MARTLPSSAHRFDVAHLTLLSGIAFLERRTRGAADAADLTPSFPQGRFVGNHLRELDVFLTALLDAAACALGASAGERRRFRRARSTHRKLEALLALAAADARADPRLCAAGTLRSCLHLQGGALGGLDRAALARDARQFGATLGDERLILPQAALLAICGLYRRAGGQVAHAVRRGADRDIDLSPLKAHLGCANVACDGF